MNGSFTSGATFSGFFTLNGATRSILSSNITTQAETGFLERTYTSVGTGRTFVSFNASVPGDFAVQFFTPDISSALVFWFGGTPTSFTGGAIQPYPASCAPGMCLPSSERRIRGGPFALRGVASGSATLVPESSAALLLVPALGGLFLRRVRRRHSRVA